MAIPDHDHPRHVLRLPLFRHHARLPVDTYLTDRERRRVHRRSLPKKLLVRFHPSERNDLEPKGDCLKAPEPE